MLAVLFGPTHGLMSAAAALVAYRLYGEPATARFDSRPSRPG